MKPLSFTEAGSWRGNWWLPGSEEPVRPGTLVYDPDAGLTLQLFSVLRNRTHLVEVHPGVAAHVVDDGHYEVVHGSVSGQSVTLLDCQSLRSRSRMTARGATTGSEDLSVGIAVLGAEFAGIDAAVFDRAEVSVEGLTAWTGQSAITLSDSSPPSIGVVFPDDPTARVPGAVYRLRHWTLGFNPSHRGDGMSVSVRHEVKLIVDTDSPASLREIRDHVRNVVDLVSIARRARPQILAFGLGLAGTHRVDFEACAVWNQRSAAPRDRESVSFTAADLGFEQVISTWLARRSDLINAANLLQATWDDGWYLESSVLALATAVESLASTYDLPLKMSKSDYKVMRESVVAAAPEDRQEWLRNLLAPLNGPSLMTKILAVADHLPEDVRDRLVPRDGTWAPRLSRVRNDLSHSGRTKVDLEVLASLRQVTASVLYLALLRELGLPDGQIASALESDGYLSYACTRSARDLGPATGSP